MVRREGTTGPWEGTTGQGRAPPAREGAPRDGQTTIEGQARPITQRGRDHSCQYSTTV